jgi:hypothetical protein
MSNLDYENQSLTAVTQMSDRNTNRGFHDRKKSQLPTNNYLSSIEGKNIDLIPK